MQKHHLTIFHISFNNYYEQDVAMSDIYDEVRSSNVYLTAKETHIIQYPFDKRNLNQTLSELYEYV